MAIARPSLSRPDSQSLLDASSPLRDRGDLDPLVGLVGDARFVLLGEASHGTSEYYRWRTIITQRLVIEKGFTAVAVECDWPDCRRVHRYVRDGDGTAREVLGDLARWPTWMWANEETVELVEWMRVRVADGADLSFYGLDVYSLWESLDEILHYLQRNDPARVSAAYEAFACLDAAGRDDTAYRWRHRWLENDCEDELVELLDHLRRHRTDQSTDDAFDAEQNARVAETAEEYDRTMLAGGPASWNFRDRHMADTLDRIAEQHGRESKIVVWAHNTHVGDARFTSMASAGMWNLGQLVRERHSDENVVLVGFGSYTGTVMAARQWGGRPREMRLPAAQPGSWEDVLHEALGENRLLLLSSDPSGDLYARGHRAVGVVYRPENESGSYVPTVLPRRYDAFLYFDQTRALHLLYGVGAAADDRAERTIPPGM